MPDPDDTDITYHIGDSDLMLLGFAAGLAARWHMLRKGGSVPLPGFPRDDMHAVELVNQGLAVAVDVPLDAVPEVYVSVHATQDTINRMLERLGPGFPFNADGGEGWEGDDA